MTTRVSPRGLTRAKFLLLAALMAQATAPAMALTVERLEIIAISAPGGNTHDHREYYILMDAFPASEPKKVSLMPMTESVADTIEDLREGPNVCEGKRFKNQIFQLFNCVARH
jgi:hypothetical protein